MATAQTSESIRFINRLQVTSPISIVCEVKNKNSQVRLSSCHINPFTFYFLFLKHYSWFKSLHKAVGLHLICVSAIYGIRQITTTILLA